jgi:hypothetical protein
VKLANFAVNGGQNVLQENPFPPNHTLLPNCSQQLSFNTDEEVRLMIFPNTKTTNMYV